MRGTISGVKRGILILCHEAEAKFMVVARAACLIYFHTSMSFDVNDAWLDAIAGRLSV